jgi:hypothetical protein
VGINAACAGRVNVRLDAGERRGPEHGRRPEVREQRQRREPEREALDHVVDLEDAVAAEPVARERGERRDHRRGDQLDHRRDAGRGRAAAGVRVDEDRDPRGVLRHVESEEGELDAEQRAVPRHRTEGRERPPHQRATVRSPIARTVASSKASGSPCVAMPHGGTAAEEPSPRRCGLRARRASGHRPEPMR